jgi:hypothetical protein
MEGVMQFLSHSRALVALACLSTAAFAALPLVAAAQATPGTVLFSRTMNGTVDGFTAPVSSAIFSINDDGTHERQFTPYTQGVFNIPSVGAYDDLAPGNEGLWLTNAFNPKGTYSVYLEAHSTLPHYNDTPYHGKYYIVNAYGVRTPPMFFGTDDLENPNDGPSYGSVAWGPVDDQIAYANASDAQPHKHPPCIHLMHSNGSDNHVLWCASKWYYRGIEGIRWSGDGHSLLAYAVRTDPTPNPEADIYVINTTTGATTLVEVNTYAPYTLGSVGDISYDGHEVIYGVTYDSHDPGPCNVASNATPIVWCAKNLLTGQTVALTDPSNAVRFGGRTLISPDGSQAFLTGATVAPTSDYELYAVKTDGSGIRKITSPCVTMKFGTTLSWVGVRVSPDGTRMLANCNVEQYPPAPVVYTNKVMVVNLADGSARFVTNGTAYDWHTQ